MKTAVMWTLALAGVIDGSVAQARDSWTRLKETPSLQVLSIVSTSNVLPAAISDLGVPNFASSGGVNWIPDALPENGNKTARVGAWITEDANSGAWVATSPDSPNGPEIFYQSGNNPWTQIFGASVYPIAVANPNTTTCVAGSLPNATMFGIGVDGNVYYSAHSVTPGACNDAWHYISDLPTGTVDQGGLVPFSGHESASGIALFFEQGHTSICSPNNYLPVALGSATGNLYKFDELTIVRGPVQPPLNFCAWLYMNGAAESDEAAMPGALTNGYVIGGGNDVYQYTLSSNSWSVYTSARPPSNADLMGISFAFGKLYGWDETDTPFLYTP
jgi:hypothetical protein